MTQDTDVLNIHCDLTSDSLVDGEEPDIIFSFGTSTLRASFGFVLEPRRIIFNPVNKTNISSIEYMLLMDQEGQSILIIQRQHFH